MLEVELRGAQSVELLQFCSSLLRVDLKPPSRRAHGELARSSRNLKCFKVQNCHHFQISSTSSIAPRRSKCTIVLTSSFRALRVCNYPHFEPPTSHRPPLRCSKCTTVVTLSSLRRVDLKPPSRRARGESAGSPRSSQVLQVCNCLHFELSSARSE